MTHTTTTEKQTLALGKKIAKTLQGGEVITLSGNLGAGKTIFTKGLAQGLEVKKIVTSPTFIIMNVYPAKYNNIEQLVHIDCYRTTSAQEISDIGATEYFNQPNTITVIEWPERIKEILPKKRIDISINLEKENLRKITIDR